MESTSLKISVKAEKSAACSVKFDVEVPVELVSAAFKKVTGDYIRILRFTIRSTLELSRVMSCKGLSKTTPSGT